MLRNIVQLSLKPIRSAGILKTVNLEPIIKCRYSTKWSGRRPVAIVNEDELFDDTKTTATNTHEMTYKTRRQRSRVQERKKERKNQEVVTKKVVRGSTYAYTALQENDKSIRYIMS